MKICRIILCLTMLWVISLNSQSTIDSLQTLLQDSKGLERIDILNELASYNIKNNMNEVARYAEEGLALSVVNNYSFGLAQANYHLGVLARKENRLDDAVEYLSRAQNIQIENAELKDEGNYLNTYYYLVGIYKQMGNYKIALEYCEKLLLEAEKLKIGYYVISAHISLGSLHDRIGNFEEAKYHNERALQLDEVKSNPERRAKIYNNIGVNYKNQGYYELSIEYLLNSLKLKEEMGYTLLTSSTLNNIGSSYKHLSNLPLALEYYQKSLHVKELANNRKGMAKTFNNIALIYEEQEDYDKALKFYEKSLMLKEELGMKLGIAVTLNNLGKMHLVLEKFDIAFGYLKRSLAIKEELNDRVGIAETLNHLGNYYLVTGYYDMAEAVLTRDIILAEDLKLRDKMKYNYKLQSDLAIARKDYLTALNYLKKYNEVKEKIINQTKSAQIAEQHIRYETEKKEQEIDILTKDNKIKDFDLKQRRLIEGFMVVALFIFVAWVVLLISNSRARRRANQEMAEANQKIKLQKIELEEINAKQKELLLELRRADAAKDKFFSIIAHDLRSPLAVQKSGTKILTKHISNLSKDEITKVVVAMADNVDMLDRLLDNLLQWAHLQKGGFPNNPVVVNLYELATLRLDILEPNTEAKSIKIKVNIEKDMCVYADYNMIESILHNLITNAIKFTHKLGNIQISAMILNDMIEVRIKDSGIGISAKKVNNLFQIDENVSSRGTEGEKGSGLGLLLCKDFVELNGGEIMVESKEGEGTCFSFTLPIG